MGKAARASVSDDLGSAKCLEPFQDVGLIQGKRKTKELTEAETVDDWSKMKEQKKEAAAGDEERERERLSCFFNFS